MPFTADLNPKKSSMDLGDLLKMDEAFAKNKAYSNAQKTKSKPVTATPGADSVMQSKPMDIGVPFKFGNNYQSED